MSRVPRTLALAALLALAGCSTIQPTAPPASSSGSADYSVVASLGTSVSAGTQSGGLVIHHQTRAFPALFAWLAGAARFDQPGVSADGLPPLLRLVSLGPPLIITSVGRTAGSPLNATLPTAYHHLAVPGAILPDVVVDTSRYGGASFQLILRRRGDMLAQLKRQLPTPPTFVTFEFGANEILGAATQGSGTALIPPATWAFLLNATLNALQDSLPNAKLAIFNVPDVTTIPFFTTIPPFVLGPTGRPVLPLVPLIGPGSVPLAPGDLVLLTAGPLLAAGTGYPTGTTSYVSGSPVPGNNNPLPDAVVLSASEVSSLRTAVSAYNSAVATQAASRGAALVDFNALLRAASTTGFEIQGTTYTSQFLSGGLFSLDGVHPNDLAHAILCNALVDAVNARFGSTLPHADLGEAQTYRADGALPPRDERVPVPARDDTFDALRALFAWREPLAP